MPLKVLSVVGARPNFMKVGPLHRAFAASGLIESLILHTGQHYDERMSDVFFRQLELPKPDIYLGIGSGSHAAQTARIMISFEGALIEHKPDVVLVVGDVNSTLACSLVAVKLHIPVVHVEAGLRSGDRRMPEEINRIVTDSISHHLFVTEQSGLDNLKAEGVPDEKVHFVGNVMIDSLIHFREKASRTGILDMLGVSKGNYLLTTMHRPSNVDSKDQIERVLDLLEGLTTQLPVVFPLHPRTRNRIHGFGYEGRLAAISNLHVTDPLGYLEFLSLMENAKAVVTDSGGIQEETTWLKVPCITLRENTERPVTIDLGTNQLMSLDPPAIQAEVERILQGEVNEGIVPPLWDGKASNRVAEALLEIYAAKVKTPM